MMSVQSLWRESLTCARGLASVALIPNVDESNGNQSYHGTSFCPGTEAGFLLTIGCPVSASRIARSNWSAVKGFCKKGIPSNCIP